MSKEWEAARERLGQEDLDRLRLEDLQERSARKKKLDDEADAYARNVLEHWDEWQARRRALEEKYRERLQRLKEMTHAELAELGKEIHQYILDDIASDGALLCNAELAAIGLMKIQIIDEERKRRIVSYAFGTPGQVRALRGLESKARKNRTPIVGERKAKRAKPAPRSQGKLF